MFLTLFRLSIAIHFQFAIWKKIETKKLWWTLTLTTLSKLDLVSIVCREMNWKKVVNLSLSLTHSRLTSLKSSSSSSLKLNQIFDSINIKISFLFFQIIFPNFCNIWNNFGFRFPNFHFVFVFASSFVLLENKNTHQTNLPATQIYFDPEMIKKKKK